MRYFQSIRIHLHSFQKIMFVAFCRHNDQIKGIFVFLFGVLAVISSPLKYQGSCSYSHFCITSCLNKQHTIFRICFGSRNMFDLRIVKMCFSLQTHPVRRHMCVIMCVHLKSFDLLKCDLVA